MLRRPWRQILAGKAKITGRAQAMAFCVAAGRYPLCGHGPPLQIWRLHHNSRSLLPELR